MFDFDLASKYGSKFVYFIQLLIGEIWQSCIALPDLSRNRSNHKTLLKFKVYITVGIHWTYIAFSV